MVSDFHKPFLRPRPLPDSTVSSLEDIRVGGAGLVIPLDDVTDFDLFSTVLFVLIIK